MPSKMKPHELRTCNICQDEKRADEFGKRAGSSQPARICLECSREREEARRDSGTRPGTGIPKRTCAECGKSMEIYGFRKFKDGHRSDVCRLCVGKKDRLKYIHSDIKEMMKNRPKTRADCINGPRPCPWVGCKYHMWLDVTKDGRVLYRPGDEGADSCVLDMVERGPMTESSIARSIGVSRERARQILQGGLKKLADSDLRDVFGPPSVKGKGSS